MQREKYTCCGNGGCCLWPRAERDE
uniref:Uncharacterized protein n=1 Tax=Rhizophora mucronata TaxID=61149 RepID=A0A2P2KF68_RHIMU